MNWKVLVVDDEAPARKNLAYALAEHKGWQLLGSCKSAAEARALLDAHPVDLVFLDIRMPHESGLEFAESLCKRAHCPLIIFITAFDQHALAAFELYAIDYILKPFDDERFGRALRRADEQLRLRQHAGPQCERDGDADIRQFLGEHRAAEAGIPLPPLQYVVVRSMGYTERVAISQVQWIRSSGNYVELNTEKRAVLHRSTLAQLEVRLPPAEFMRVHRTAIVRRSEIRRVSVEGDGQYAVQLSTGAQVPVSERYIAAVRAEFG